MFAVYFSIKKLHYLIGGRKFYVKTDHKNLQYWSHTSASPKIERWKVFLSEYDFVMEYIKGEDNCVADALSRMPTTLGGEASDMALPVIVNSQTSGSSITIIVEQAVARADTQFDSEIEKVHGKYGGHFGIKESIRRLREKGISWESMVTDVSSFIRSCKVCQKLSKASTGSHGQNFSVAVDEPNKRIAMDSVGPLEEDSRGYKYILVLIDCMSRFVELFPTRTLKAEECAEKLLEFFSRNGAPESILSDNHKEFMNSVVQKFMEYTGTRIETSIP